jgi:hypothetical protein
MRSSSAILPAEPQPATVPVTKPGVAFDEAVLDLDGAGHGVDHAAEFDQAAVAGALDDARMMRGDGGIDQIDAQPPTSPVPREADRSLKVSQTRFRQTRAAWRLTRYPLR